ncbi:Cilia- and flagella-associated protein 100 [Physocladia obscura]|uniref:Cilia- and flagella-associated protein 100 n=1 Tax=Physocladia obscura TaxID=109957 RepID=A0AAD5SVF9_9FUNG|nr:Cilia- and flagella-associated protein 100 [Physocladia obscura]
MKSGKVRADNNDAASEDATEEAEEIENTISAPQSGSGNVQNHHRTHIQHHHVPTMAIATVTTINGNTTIGGGGGDEEFDFDDEYWNDEDDEALLYFKTPHQLLDIFAELEENNLALIQNCQETEETLEELKQKIVETESQMEKETLSLTQQIEFLNSAIAREEEKARQLEERAKMFSTGLVGVESQEKLLEDLNHKVKDVYRRCIGDSDANLDTLQMLTNIENKLEQLFEVIENMPKDKVEQAEKTKDKERRRRQREEKMETQRALQEKRVQIALERAKAPVKKKVGKPVVFRSAPPQKKKKKEETKKKEEEDVEYYFSV